MISFLQRVVVIFDKEDTRMTVFREADQFYDCVGALMDLAKTNPTIGPQIAKSKLVVQFIYQEPDAITTVDARSKPTQPGAFVDVHHGDCPLKPDIQMSMRADLAHKFWQGKLNLLSALSKRDIIVTGPFPKILKLLPAVEPLYKIYPELLKEKGYDNLLEES
jgi:hypothetical protein